MKWKDEYATGVPRIDEQHKMLFVMIDDFAAAFSDGVGARVYGGLLDSLDLYVRTHFAFEERCMTECKCPAAGRNAAAHARFIEVVNDFTTRFKTFEYRSEDAAELMAIVDKWLTGHILGIDVQLRDYAVERDGFTMLN